MWGVWHKKNGQPVMGFARFFEGGLLGRVMVFWIPGIGPMSREIAILPGCFIHL